MCKQESTHTCSQPFIFLWLPKPVPGAEATVGFDRFKRTAVCTDEGSSCCWRFGRCMHVHWCIGVYDMARRNSPGREHYSRCCWEHIREDSGSFCPHGRIIRFVGCGEWFGVCEPARERREVLTAVVVFWNTPSTLHHATPTRGLGSCVP